MPKNKANLRVGFLTPTNPKDKSASSGVHYSMFHALEKEFKEVIPLGPISIKKNVLWVLKSLGFLHLKLLGGAYNPWHSISLGKHYANQYLEKINQLNLDVIYAPKASTSVSFLDLNIPICYATDITFGQIIGYYQHYSNFSKLSIKESLYVEKQAIKRSKKIIFQTEWAKEYFVNNHEFREEDISVIKHGANIFPLTNAIPDRDYSKTINLLFVGIEWERKGGDIAFEALQILLDKGYDLTLTVCGCTPPVSHPKLKVIPFLNKNIPAQKQQFEKLFVDSHLFILPTRADCLPVVNSEACAYGLPVISTDTGGVSAGIIDGYNGYTLPIDVRGKEYADKVESLLLDKEKWKKMSENARQQFEEDLNWTVWAKKTKQVILSAVK